MAAANLGSSCLYIIFVATSFRSVINHELSVDWDVRYYIVVTLIPCILIGEIRKMKHLVPFSIIANLCLIITFAITLWYILKSPLDIGERPLFQDWSGVPVFFR